MVALTAAGLFLIFRVALPSEARQLLQLTQRLIALVDAVERLCTDLRRTPPPFVVTCARGSSDHAATYAKYLFETQLGTVTWMES